ncbi:MAG: phosphoglycerate dehydrogenase [Planctomyces sp.]
MLRVLCTALNVQEGCHLALFNQAGFQCDVVDRSLDLKDPKALSRAIHGYQAILAGSEPYTAAVLDSSLELRVISRYGVGFDAIDLSACDARGIVVTTTPGCNHHSVAEHAIALLMGIARGFPAADQEVRQGIWTRHARPRVMGSTLGLVGLGRIGQATATRGLGLGMRVIAYDPFPPKSFLSEHGIQSVSLSELLSTSDYVSLHLPVLPETRHVINAQTIEQMKTGSVLINTSRGPLVDETALIAALKSGKLRAAGLDVFETEPLPVESPLLKMPNVLLSGHVAGLDNESHDATCELAAKNIIALHRGEWPAECIQNMKSVKGWKWARS